MKMDEEIIIRVIRGEATQKENMRMLDWIRESDDNLKEFSELKMIWTLSSTPDEMAREEDLINFKKVISARSAFSVKDRKFWYGFATAVSAAIVILFVGFFSGILGFKDSISTDKKELANLTAVNQRYMYTDKGVKGKVVLPDGSVVLLNSGSTIKYPDKFTGSAREVELSGEGYFDVVKDSLNPMIVTTIKGIKVKVLGTKFLLKSYDNDSETKAILYSGKINLTAEAGKNREEQSIIMSPNDCVVVPAEGELLVTKTRKEGNDDAWMRGELIFTNTPMPEVLKILERWYGKTFVVNNKSLNGFDLNASFKNESLIQILGIIEFCTSVKYRIDEDKVIFY
ncbi:MAG: hypothetical protein A2X18_02680 [Bacteroidetes bacterium GWF2_40_14]|nr:MAG: hypothetical protein A2X18_02680 [Bacteroidetes bacterium GWF2_40_14]